jgi:hypothetical protein
MDDEPQQNDENEAAPESEEFGELIKYTGAGFAGGLLLGAILDYLGFSTSGIGQWLVRTLAGEGESVLEGLFALKKRINAAAGSMAQAYGWGKLLGMTFPWVVDAASRTLGINVYGIEGFYIPYFYALSDQIGANVSGFVFLYRRETYLSRALYAYFSHPVMVTGLFIILLVPNALLGARIMGFSPKTQVYTALETIAANLCWLPPLVGWLSERRVKGRRLS